MRGEGGVEVGARGDAETAGLCIVAFWFLPSEIFSLRNLYLEYYMSSCFLFNMLERV